MRRRRLYTQVWIMVLIATFVPLFLGEFFALRIMEDSVLDQVKKKHEQLAKAGGAMVLDYIKVATTKLKSIAQMIRKEEDPRAQTKRLNTLLDPPDIFLEVSYWTTGKNPEVLAQVQQDAYNSVQSRGNLSNRSYNPKVGQQVQSWSMDSPILNKAANGMPYAADTLEKIDDYLALPISVPVPNGGVLTANVDFRRIQEILWSLSNFAQTQFMSLSDRTGKIISAPASGLEDSPDVLKTEVDVGHGGWRIAVHQDRGLALAPVDQVKKRFWWFAIGAQVLATFVAGLITARIVSPVLSLAKTADALRRGNLAVRTGITRKDEIGQLAESFDKMAAAVQQLDAMKSEFVAHVSHELRTPLTSAKMALANVQEGLTGKESLSRVQEDLDRLIRMVNELLDIAKIEAGLPLAKQKTDLAALVRSSAETLRPLARVEMTVTGSGETVELDAARVQQIVVNLVDNALKYAKSRVDIEIRGREVRVTDDGPGVPPEHRERIFEKFSKVETGPKPPGAGLGLSIARKLAELHGGSLGCEGNTFVLRL